MYRYERRTFAEILFCQNGTINHENHWENWHKLRYEVNIYNRLSVSCHPTVNHFWSNRHQVARDHYLNYTRQALEVLLFFSLVSRLI